MRSGGKTMARIAHIAVKVEDLGKAAEFYENVFGFTPTGKSRSEDRDRRRCSDGQIDLTFLRYDSEESAMAKAAGEGPCFTILLSRWRTFLKLWLRFVNLAVRFSVIQPSRRSNFALPEVRSWRSCHKGDIRPVADSLWHMAYG
jgi:Glyoxalase/Bleomycin resistance protein/Dioxygenase superfamily